MSRVLGRSIGLAVSLAALAIVASRPAEGALRVHPDNPRWLTDDGGKTALVLTGAHTWSIFQDLESEPDFDAVEYLKGLDGQGHNFTRGWFWEDAFYSPLPYEKERGLYRLSGPYNRDYLKRLRSRLRAARQRGLYVSVMLFQGWSMGDLGGLRRPGPWPQNPYNRDNHNERVTKQSAALHIGIAQQQQLDYVTYLADRLCSESGVIWEVANEAHPSSFGAARASNWQQAILERFTSECGRRLTWVSCPQSIELSVDDERSLNDRMVAMEADLVSPCDAGGLYSTNPPVADGRRVVVVDSDHLRFEALDGAWAWKTFLRGQHPIFMDLTQSLAWWSGPAWDVDDPRWAEIRGALGAIQEVVATVNRPRSSGTETGLAALVPQRGAGGQPNARTRPSSSAWTLYSSDRPCKRKGEGTACRKARANGEELVAWVEAEATVRFCRLEAGETYRFRWKNAARPGYVGPAETGPADSTGCFETANPSDLGAVIHLERAPG